jgi:hypothetical protein
MERAPDSCLTLKNQHPTQAQYSLGSTGVKRIKDSMEKFQHAFPAKKENEQK